MKIHKIIVFVALGASFITTNSYATNLLEVYEKALANDPTFKGARATWLADKESIGIARAELLPLLNAKGSIARSIGTQENSPTRNDNITNQLLGTPMDQLTYQKSYSSSATYALQLTQPIFDFGKWSGVWYAQAVAKKAKATFMAAEESLLSRTAKAYLAVLLAKDVLSYAKANKASVERLFIQAKHKFDVGLIPVTDLEDARKNYDLAVSSEIGSYNDLNDKIEQLNEITNVRYENLDSIKKDFPLLSPKPDNIEQWAKAAEKQNLELTAARFDTIAAHENVKAQNSGHLPTLNATAEYDYAYNKNTGADTFSRGKTATAGLSLAVPIFSGGKVVASARQADYQYQAKLSEQERIHRSVISKTRQAYLGVLSSISKIKADKQAIKSAESSLRANQASYTVGTHTMADVLKAQSDLYNAQKTFSEDEYNYIMQILTLKEQTGILDVSDLAQINSWLEKESTTSSDDKKRSNKKAKLQKTAAAASTVSPSVSATKTASTVAATSSNVAALNSTTTNTSDKASNITTPTPTDAADSGKIVITSTEQVEAVAPTTSAKK